MRSSAVMRFVLVVVGSLAAAGVLLALLLLINSDCGFVGCSGLMPYGWIIPLVAGVVLGLVVMLLMNQDDAASEDSSEMRSTACSACGEMIIDDWRLCPHCGQMRTCDVSIKAPVGISSTARGQ